jgi:3-oxoacyl-[acyl-carrier protein] reductase
MDLGLRDRVAIVEASSGGLGRAVAEALAAEGVRLALCSRSEARLEAVRADIQRTHGTEVIGLVADVSKQDDVKRMVESTVSRFGQVDICVANGPGPPTKSFLDVEIEEWQRAIELNFMSTVLVAKEVLPLMARDGWGRFIVISSIVAKQPERGFILSNAVRPGLSGLVRTLADEFGSRNVTINAVLPGTFATNRLENVTADANYDRWTKANSLGRLGRPEEFGAVVAFLCSQKASFITGASLAVDGGFSKSLF